MLSWKAALVFLVTRIFVWLGWYSKGRSDANLRNERDQLKAKDETRNRIDSVDTSGDDTDWLRNRSQR